MCEQWAELYVVAAWLARCGERRRTCNPHRGKEIRRCLRVGDVRICANLMDLSNTERAESTLVTGCLLAVFTYVFLANAWIGDDAYITFRVVDNFVNGYGLTFNPGERVQAYTHPLWMLLLSAAYVVTSNLFYTTLAVSYAFCVATLTVAFKSLKNVWRSALFFGVLLSSKAFIDYTSSGLEYPLSFLLLSIFYCRFFSSVRNGVIVSPPDLIVFGGIASLAFLNRSDSILLYAGPLAY